MSCCATRTSKITDIIIMNIFLLHKIITNNITIILNYYGTSIHLDFICLDTWWLAMSIGGIRANFICLASWWLARSIGATYLDPIHNAPTSFAWVVGGWLEALGPHTSTLSTTCRTLLLLLISWIGRRHAGSSQFQANDLQPWWKTIQMTCLLISQVCPCIHFNANPRW